MYGHCILTSGVFASHNAILLDPLGTVLSLVRWGENVLATIKRTQPERPNGYYISFKVIGIGPDGFKVNPG